MPISFVEKVAIPISLNRARGIDTEREGEIERERERESVERGAGISSF